MESKTYYIVCTKDGKTETDNIVFKSKNKEKALDHGKDLFTLDMHDSVVQEITTSPEEEILFEWKFNIDCYKLKKKTKRGIELIKEIEAVNKKLLELRNEFHHVGYEEVEIEALSPKTVVKFV